jgi:ETFB lysine methyltransferase
MSTIYQVKSEPYTFAGLQLTVRSLKDLQQFSDPHGNAELAGISSALWPIFGNIWPSGLILAEIIGHEKLANLRILEIGCGLGIPSLMAQLRGADISACDLHPEAGVLMQHNTELNHLADIPFFTCNWDTAQLHMGCFDLIIGSDLLYEAQHPAQLAGFIQRHMASHGQVIMIDPGRKLHGKFTRHMQANGFIYSERRASDAQMALREFSGKILNYRR